jgi:hypothetical protein
MILATGHPYLIRSNTFQPVKILPKNSLSRLSGFLECW